MTPTPGLHACPGFFITEKVFGHTPDCRVPRLKRKGRQRQTIYNPARRHSTCHLTFYSQLLPKSLGGSYVYLSRFILSVFLLSRCKVKERQKHFFLKSNFRIGTEHLILFGRHVFTDVFWFSKLLALLTICVFSAQVSQCNAGHL